MVAMEPPAIGKSTTSNAELIPWDPESPQHVERLFQQRIACGWDEDKIEAWRELQRRGKMNLQWVVLSDTDAEKEQKLEKHIAAFPTEAAQLAESATSFGGKPWSPEPGRKFNPVGHISLNSETVKKSPMVPEYGHCFPGVYYIVTFYISSVLQGAGLGRAAMDVVERMATSEPLCAKTLCLNTVARVYAGKDERWAAMGMEPPKMMNQDWYERRGYTVYEREDACWFDKDPTGKKWPITAVYMRKDID